MASDRTPRRGRDAARPPDGRPSGALADILDAAGLEVGGAPHPGRVEAVAALNCRTALAGLRLGRLRTLVEFDATPAGARRYLALDLDRRARRRAFPTARRVASHRALIALASLEVRSLAERSPEEAAFMCRWSSLDPAREAGARALLARLLAENRLVGRLADEAKRALVAPRRVRASAEPMLLRLSLPARRVWRFIAQENRRRTYDDVAFGLHMGRATVSKALKTLKAFGIVRTQPDGSLEVRPFPESQ